MSKKMLVTKEWHKKAMKAIQLAQATESIHDIEVERIVTKATVKFIEEEMSEEVQERFMDYIDTYVEAIMGDK